MWEIHVYGRKSGSLHGQGTQEWKMHIFFYSLEAVTYLEEQRSMRRRQLDFVSNTKYKEMCPFELREDTAVNQAAFTKGHVQLCHFEVWRCSISALDDVSEKGQTAKKKKNEIFAWFEVATSKLQGD